MPSKLTRVLVVTDHLEPTPALLDAVRRRAEGGPVQVRIIVPNPAAAEWHPLHPERHVKAQQALRVLGQTVSVIEESCDVLAEGCVATAHDPMDAIEQSLDAERFDEILVAMTPHGLAHRLHLDLPHRLAHLHVPVTEITDPTRGGAVLEPRS
jgi:hypothetical protein